MLDLNKLLAFPKTIAVVGLSDKSDRPSYQVAKYLKDLGLTIIPVNPNIKDFLGIKAYSSLSEIPREIKIDIVDIFRNENEVLPIIDEIIKRDKKIVAWLQSGFFKDEARSLAQKYKIELIEGTCLMMAFKNKQ